ncbi:MAG: CRISPR-associated protein Cas5 [Verrucomicrobiota bacterium]
MKSHLLQLEISGPIALWAHPDTMPNPVSYVASTCSAAKGIFEAILRWNSVGSAGDLPAPVGDPPNGTVGIQYFLRRVARRNGRVACAPHAFNYPLSESGCRDGTARCATENHAMPVFLEPMTATWPGLKP